MKQLNLHRTIYRGAEKLVTVNYKHDKLNIQSMRMTGIPASSNVFGFPIEFELAQFYCRFYGRYG